MARPEDAEILIHIAAPSKTSDDIRYRSLAAAYIDFQPHRLEQLSGPSPAAISNGSGDIPAASLLQEAARERSSGERFSSPVSPLASFRSVLDNANSQTRFSRPLQHAPIYHISSSNKSAEESSWNTPPSIVQDSVPENDVTTSLLTTPTRVLEHYLQHFTTPSQMSQNLNRRREPAEVESRKSPLSSHQQSVSNHESSQPIIPCTPEKRQPGKKLLPTVFEPGTSQGSSQQLHTARQSQSNTQSQEPEEDIIEDTILQLEPATPQTARADSEPPPSKRLKLDKSDASPGALLRTSSDIGLHNAPTSSTRSITFLPKYGYGYDRLNITSPEPPTGHDTIMPEDLITPGLEKLAQDLKIPKRYRPESVARELRPFERGYWQVDCTDWPPDLKTEAWVFLANYIGKGVAGWGVSCHRDERFTCLRLYCWGLLVTHIYFVIYVASRRRVCFSTAAWVDASGDTVVKMAKKDGVWKRY